MAERWQPRLQQETVLLRSVGRGLSGQRQRPSQQPVSPSSLARLASQLVARQAVKVACLRQGQSGLALGLGSGGLVGSDLVVLVGSHKEGNVQEGQEGQEGILAQVEDTIQEERHMALEGSHQGLEVVDQRDPIQ